MKIGIDIRAACGKKTGKGWYTFHVVKELLALDKKNEYLLYTDRITGDLIYFQNAHIKLLNSNRFFWHFAVIKDFIKNKGDVFFAPTSFIIPAFLPKQIKSVITVHDLVSFIHPSLHHNKSTIIERLFFRKALSKTSNVVVPSKNTKKDLIDLFKYKKDKITVTPLAADPIFFERPGNLNEIKKKYDLPDNFVLAVGGLEPRKNMKKLLEAMEIVSQKHKDLRLVIVGGKGWKSEKLQKKISGAKNSVTHIEHCDYGDLPYFYRLARVFVFPSIYEGFGLPPLEAAASGCPVICSRAASLPEVCGDSAIFIDPNDSAEIAAAIEKIVADRELAGELAEKGLNRAKKFSWRFTAEKTLECLEG